jgi:hypothetical protein
MRQAIITGSQTTRYARKITTCSRNSKKPNKLRKITYFTISFREHP